MAFTTEQIRQFQEDGFLILPEFLDPTFAARAADRFEPMFRGEFPTGLQPDEWNWREGRDREDITRQICNGWKSDPIVAAIVLSEAVGAACSQLAGWTGARIGQDNVLWKPPGASALGYHQDDSYCQWVVPANYMTCWIALDDTTADGGTLEYVRGSHLWGKFPMIRQFHAPDDYHEALKIAAEQVGQRPEIVHVEIPRGGCAIHAGATWHGSGRNSSPQHRRNLVAHCIAAHAQFHPHEISYIYNRYKHRNSRVMDEDFFPMLWTEERYRTPWLHELDPPPFAFDFTPTDCK